MPAKEDIRITKTHRALAGALLTLLEKTPFPKITVNDICKEALVSRSTFYLHFEDKYELARFCIQRQHEEIIKQTKHMSAEQLLRFLLERVQEQNRLFQILSRDEMDAEVMQMIRESFVTPFLQRLREREQAGESLCGPVETMAAFYANGVAGTIIHWIQSGYLATIDEMAKCQYGLIAGIL